MTSRDRLRSELSLAEAALKKAVIWSHSKPGEEDPLIESARTACRRIRAEFIRLEELVDQTTPPGRIDLLLSELRSLNVHELVARKPVPAPPAAKPIAVQTTGATAAATPAESLVARARAARWLRLNAVGKRILRQSLGLLALVLAYLAYYHLDVQLQILTLPRSGLEQWHKEVSRGSSILLVGPSGRAGYAPASAAASFRSSRLA